MATRPNRSRAPTETLPCLVYFELIQPGSVRVPPKTPVLLASPVKWAYSLSPRLHTWSAWKHSAGDSGCWSPRWRYSLPSLDSARAASSTNSRRDYRCHPGDELRAGAGTVRGFFGRVFRHRTQPSDPTGVYTSRRAKLSWCPSGSVRWKYRSPHSASRGGASGSRPRLRANSYIESTFDTWMIKRPHQDQALSAGSEMRFRYPDPTWKLVKSASGPPYRCSKPSEV